MAWTSEHRVALLMGGTSAEREISLNSGRAVLDALTSQGYQVTALDVTGPESLALIADGQFDVVFNMLHGRGGEDGVMQGVLEMLQVPYTGSRVTASAIAMDKLITKRLWSAAGLPTPPYVVLHEPADLARVAAELGFPVIVKPAKEGSSIGMSKVESAEALQAAWENARQFGEWVFAEAWIVGAEYTAAVLGAQSLPLIKLETSHAFYDYDAKYLANDTRYLCPCGLNEATEADYQALAKKAFDVLGAEAWGRVDLMVDAEGSAYLIELNTVPGMTSHSLVPMAAKQAGLSFEQLVVEVLNLAR